VPFDIDDPIVAAQLDGDLDPICETHHLQVLDRGDSPDFWWSFDRRRSEAANHLVVGFPDLPVSTDTDGLVVPDCALCIGPTDMAGTDALATGVTLPIKRTVMVGDTAHNGLASLDVGISDGVNGTDTFVTPRLVPADCSCGTGAPVPTEGDPSALSVRQQFEPMGADTEARSVPCEDTLLVGGAGVGGGAVLALDEAVVTFPEETGRAATGVRVQADQIPRAVVGDPTLPDGEADLVGVSLVPSRAVTGALVILRLADGILSTLALQLSICSGAWVVTLSVARVTLLVGRTVMVRPAAVEAFLIGLTPLDVSAFEALLSLAVAPLSVGAVCIMEADMDRGPAPVRSVGIAHQGQGAGTLVPPREVLTDSPRAAWEALSQTLIDILALVVGTDVAPSAVRVSLALDEHFPALLQGVPCVAGSTAAVGLVLLCPTNGVHSTHPSDVTGGLAESVHTGLVVRAVGVGPAPWDALVLQTDLLVPAVLVSSALRRDLPALHVGVPSEPTRAGADCDVVPRGTGGSPATGPRDGTCIDALVPNASFFLRTVARVPAPRDAPLTGADLSQEAVRVPSALWGLLDPLTEGLGVPCVLREAGADSVMVDGLADAVDTTGSIDVAWVLTDFVDAGLLEGTVSVTAAPGDTVVGLADLPQGAGRV